ncbi:MAG: DNA uptake protein ComE-like DNA-binding protein [Halioglobus sp.]|jgi:DNA uptake protein ComE-like DNA-binding protein
MKFFWDNTYLNRDERSKLIILLSVFILLCIIKFYVVVFYQPTSIPVDKHILDSVEMVSLKKKENYYAKKEFDGSKTSDTKWKKPKLKSKKPKSFTNFRFDPNKISKDSLKLLGFSRYAMNSLLKYRSKGGVIRSLDQMSKINGLDKTTLDRLTPFVVLPEYRKKQYASKTSFLNSKDSTQLTIKKKKYKRKEPKVFDINTGDTTDFMNLHGIGRVYSKRIISFRKSLGGFFTIQQVGDVWGIEDSLFQTIKPYLSVSPGQILKRNINHMDKDSLNKHPYINWQKSKTILAYKSAHGDYQHMDDFYKLHLLEDDFVDTLKLYFVVK